MSAPELDPVSRRTVISRMTTSVQGFTLMELLDADLALAETLEILANREQRSDVKNTLNQAVACLYEGHHLSHALRQSAAKFRPLSKAARTSEKTPCTGGSDIAQSSNIQKIRSSLPDVFT